MKYSKRRFKNIWWGTRHYKGGEEIRR